MDQGGSGTGGSGGGGGGTSFDMANLTSADKLVVGGSFIYFIWSFFSVWYKYDLGPFGSAGVSGFRGFTLIAAILGLLATLEVVASKAMGMKMNMPMKRGMLHLTVAGIGLLCTLLGLVVKPGVLGVKAGLSWGYFVGLILSLVWTYGAFMMYSAPGESSAGGGMMSSGGGDTTPPMS